MKKEAPERLFVQLTPMGGTISYLEQPPDNGRPVYEYVLIDSETGKAMLETQALLEIAHWTQATLTALNVGDVSKDSPLHLKLREVMIAYRAAQSKE